MRTWLNPSHYGPCLSLLLFGFLTLFLARLVHYFAAELGVTFFFPFDISITGEFFLALENPVCIRH